MGQEDVDGVDDLIAHAVDHVREQRSASAGPARLTNGAHILQQYAALCRDVEAQAPEPSTAVALALETPKLPAERRANAISRKLRTVLARLKR